MRFELYIAARYLRAKRRQAVVGLVTLISVAGVAAGVAALVIALAITGGMQRDLQDRLLGSSAHVSLLRIKADGIRNWQPLLMRMRGLPHVTAAAPEMYEQVMVSNGPRSGFALLKAIVPSEERTVTDLLDKITAGSAADLAPAWIRRCFPRSFGTLRDGVSGASSSCSFASRSSVGDSWPSRRPLCRLSKLLWRFRNDVAFFFQHEHDGKSPSAFCLWHCPGDSRRIFMAYRGAMEPYQRFSPGLDGSHTSTSRSSFVFDCLVLARAR